MGLLIDGQWHDRWYANRDGRFEREQSKRHDWITPDGSPGPKGKTGYPAEAGRYHLYVSLACPRSPHADLPQAQGAGIAHRRFGGQLADGRERLTFDKATGSSGDALDDLEFLHQRYTRDDSDYSGRVTVPVLWDRERQCIVNNESAEIIRILNTAFDGITGSRLDFYPEPLRGEIDALNARIYPAINNGVYCAGFATTRDAYEEAFDELFRELDWVERRLASSAT